MKLDKHRLYQLAVQDPAHDARLYLGLAAQLRPEIRGSRAPVVFREDFCGTFALSCAWVRLSPSHRALALDLDPEPLEYGRKHNLPKLSPTQRSRLRVLRRDVISRTRPGADLIVAGNFSLYYFKERGTVLRYFKHALRSLKPGGLLFIEVIGGRGFTEKRRDRKRVELARGKSATYIWEQRGFDPVTSEATYAIHFRLPDGTRMENAFVYDWRLWNIRELREAMEEAGFDRTHLFWEREDDDTAYAPSERGADDEVWIAYLVGQRKASGSSEAR